MLITAFFCGSSAVFLLSGAGYPGLRILIFLIFFVSGLNLSLYAKEIYHGLRKAVTLFGGQSEEPAPKGDKGPGKGEGGEKPGQKEAGTGKPD